MAIDCTAAYRWRRLPLVAVLAVLVALLAPGGSATAQGGVCPTSSTGGSSLSRVSATDRATIVQLHNQYRDEVGVPRIAWDGSLADAAQSWTDVIAPLGELCHDPDPGDQGENLADAPSFAGGVMAWYSEKGDYDRNPGPVSPQTASHYTQMVWSSTQRVGCGQAASTRFSGNIVLTCRYSPPGNLIGEAPY
ncbi:MAG: CAP domain-containing protein [Pseudonocardiaceae bacterium]